VSVQPWYSTTDVARLLGRSDRYVRDRVKRGELPAQEGGGGERKSYKISREALLGYLMANERRNTQEVGGLLQGAELSYLREMELAIGAELRRRAGGRVAIVPKCRLALKAVMALEGRNYAQHNFFPTPGSREAAYAKAYGNPYHFAATAYNQLSDHAEGYLSIGVTSTDFYEGICNGTIHDDTQPAWEQGQTPILYINSFVVEDPVWAHFLFKEVSAQIKEFFRTHQMRINTIFAIAAGDDVPMMLERYGFTPNGYTFEGKYPVMINKDIENSRVGIYVK
jgi:excisionase family DNA binding protein